MLQCLQDSVNNPDLSENFTILRNPGTYGQGGWQTSPQVQIQAYGTVGRASNKQMEVIPEADRISEIRLFHSSTPMLVTSEDGVMTADILVWHGIQYRVLAAIPQPQRGYFAALAARMLGE
jgi:hypothetical protein